MNIATSSPHGFEIELSHMAGFFIRLPFFRIEIHAMRFATTNGPFFQAHHDGGDFSLWLGRLHVIASRVPRNKPVEGSVIG
jgi:hypothetical protein